MYNSLIAALLQPGFLSLLMSPTNSVTKQRKNTEGKITNNTSSEKSCATNAWN